MSAVAIPLLAFMIVMLALIGKQDAYAAFVEGAADALPLILSILPYMAAMMVALSVFRSSGALGSFVKLLAPGLSAVRIPPELAPLITLRPFSGSASLAVLEDIIKANGSDTFVGFSASVLLGSTETIFYTIALYFGAAKVTKTRHTIPAALISGLVGVAAAIFFSYLFWAKSAS